MEANNTMVIMTLRISVALEEEAAWSEAASKG